jgi:tetratricopeptide (TPR) repeat protein
MLVVVCSPSAARSAAVAEEIRMFKRLGRERVIALIVAGEPDAGTEEWECFPDSLKYEVRSDGSIDREWRVHPITIDARTGRGAAAGDRLANARHLLVAAALGVPPETLPQPARERGARSDDGPAAPRRSPRAAVWIAVLAVVGAGVLGWFAYQEQQRRIAAQAARQRSDELIIFLQRSMREKLAPLGQLSLLAETNERVTEHLSRVARETNDPLALMGLADAFHDSAEILEERGNHAAALESAVQAMQTRQRVAESPSAPANTALQFIGDQRLVAQIYLRMGQPREALAVAEQARASAVTLSRKRLGDEQSELALAQAHVQVGDAHLELSRLDEAERAYTAGRDAARQLATRLPRNTELNAAIASMAEKIAKLRERQGNVALATAELREWQRLLAAEATIAPKDVKAQTDLANAQLRLGNYLLVQRQMPEATAEFRKAVAVLEPVVKSDSATNATHLAYINGLQRLGMSLAFDPAAQAEALVILQRALDHLDQQFPGETDAQATAARAEVQRLRGSLMGRQPQQQ